MGVYILDGKKKVDCKYPQISEGMLTDSNNYNFTDPNVQLQNSAKKKKDTPTNWQVK